MTDLIIRIRIDGKEGGMNKKTYKVTVRAIGRNVWFREDVIVVRTATRIGAAREGKRAFKQMYHVDDCIVVQVVEVTK